MIKVSIRQSTAGQSRKVLVWLTARLPTHGWSLAKSKGVSQQGIVNTNHLPRAREARGGVGEPGGVVCPSAYTKGESMPAVTVSRKFKSDFDTFVADRIGIGAFTHADADDLKEVIRKDLTPGQDQNRNGVDCLMVDGVMVPATIDDVEDRIRLWSDFFEEECAAILLKQRCGY